MQKMNNKKGVKLLAAIAVFAMAFAGFAVIIGESNDSDATAPYSDTGVVAITGATAGVLTIDESATAAKYLVSANITVQFTDTGGSTAAPDFKFYVKNGITVTFKGAENVGTTFEVYAVTADAAVGTIAAEKIADLKYDSGALTTADSVIITAYARASTSGNGDGMMRVSGGSVTTAAEAIKVTGITTGVADYYTAGYNPTVSGNTTSDVVIAFAVKDDVNIKIENDNNKIDFIDADINAAFKITLDEATGRAIIINADETAAAATKIDAGTVNIKSGTVTVGANGIAIDTPVISAAVSSGFATDYVYLSGEHFYADVDKTTPVSGKLYVFNKAVSSGTITLAASAQIKFDKGSSFDGTISGKDASEVKSSYGVKIALSGSATVNLANSSAGVLTLTASGTSLSTTTSSGSVVVDSMVTVKSYTGSPIIDDTSGATVALGDGLIINNITTFVGSSAKVLVVPDNATVTISGAAATDAKISASSLYVYGSIDGTLAHGKIGMTSNVTCTQANKITVEAMMTSGNATTAAITGTVSSLYDLYVLQQSGFNVTNIGLALTSDTYVTVGGTQNGAAIDMEIKGWKGAITEPTGSNTEYKIIVPSGSSLKLSGGTSFETPNHVSSGNNNVVSLDLENGSELIIEESNILMPVSKAAKASVEVNAPVMKVDNPSETVKVGYMRDATLAGNINGCDIIVYGDLTIAETAKLASGSKLTVYKGGVLDVTGTLNVEGTVDLKPNSAAEVSGTMNIGTANGGASVTSTTAAFTVAETGTVNVVAPNTQAVQASSFNTLTIASSVAPIYDADLNSDGNADPDGKLDNTPCMFTVLGTLNMNGTLTADNIFDKGTISINGTVTKLADGTTDSKITLFDGISVTTTTISGTIVFSDDGVMDEAVRSNSEVSDGNTVTLTNVRGVTVTENVYTKSYTNDAGVAKKVYVSDMTISGTFNTYSTADNATGTVALGGTPTARNSTIFGKILISDDIIIGKGVALNSSANVDVTGSITCIAKGSSITLSTGNNDGKMTVTGSITVKVNDSQFASALSGEAKIVAAKTSVTEAATADVTYTYTTFENAIASIGTADNKTVNILGTVKVNESVEIPKDATVQITGTLSIQSKSDVVAAAGSKVSGAAISVSGSFTSQDYINDLSVRSISADVVSTKDASRTWTSLDKALEGATEGTVITANQAMKLGSVTIPAGVTVETKENVTVKDDSTVTVAGTLRITGAEIKTQSGSGYTGNGKVAITGNGIIAVEKDGNDEPTIFNNVSGVHFSKLDGSRTYKYITNAAYAASVADNKVDNEKFTVVGEVAMGDVTFTKLDTMTTLVIEIVKTNGVDYKTVVSGNITLVNGAVLNLKNAQFTGTVSAASADGKATITFKDVVGHDTNKVTVISNTDTTATEPVDYLYLSIPSDAKGAVTIDAGTVTVGSGNITTDADMDVTVGKNAKLVVPNERSVTVDTDADKVHFTVDGNIIINKGTVTVTGVMDLVGTAKVSESGSNGIVVSATTGILNVIGTLEISAEQGKEGKLTVNNIITVGTKPTTLGAAGTITGTVNLVDNGFLAVYDGKVDGKILKNSVEMKSTTLFVNGYEYATVYGNTSLKDAIDKLDIDLDGYETFVKEDDGNVKATVIYSDEALTQKIDGTPNIGDNEKVYFDLVSSKATVIISVGPGVTLWIDNVKYETASTGTPIAVGTHDIVVKVNPGYKGTTTAVFNGKTITNGKLVITSDMTGKTNVLSATGDVTVDPGEQPAPVEEPEDSGMGITDYLLIVLVILAAILVVVVAIRMMRS